MNRALLAGIIIVSGAGVVAKQLPEIRRYLKIEAM
jgi:hypothetical protein